jgi:hypothetical protein
MEPLLTPAQACKYFGVCRNTLASLRDRGLIQAVNLNPDGIRAVWRYRVSLDTKEDRGEDLKYLDLKRRCGL